MIGMAGGRAQRVSPLSVAVETAENHPVAAGRGRAIPLELLQ